MLGIYEFELFEDEGMVCAFPYDLEGGTAGTGWKDAAEMAADWLKGELEHMLMTGQVPPEATFGHEPTHKGGRIAIVAVEISPLALARHCGRLGGEGAPGISEPPHGRPLSSIVS